MKVFLFASIMLAGVLVSSIAQVLLKMASQKEYASAVREYLNAPVIIAYLIFFMATFLSIYAYRVVPLSMGAILESTGYLYVTVFGALIFKERITREKMLALALIILGIMIYALS